MTHAARRHLAWLIGLACAACGGGGGGGPAPENRAPTAAVSATPLAGIAPLTVTFDAGASYDPDGDALSLAWSFGDGQAAAGGTVQAHTYASAGTFTAALTVADGRGGESSWSATITVTAPNQAPVAAFTASPASGEAPLTVTFDAAGSSDADGAVTAYEWDFGDQAGASGVHLTHAYATAGSYTATLTVTDDDGATATTSRAIEVRAPTGLPPDPATVATVLDRTAATTVAASMAFLHEGDPPIQTGVAAGTIDARRGAVMRGRLLERDGSSLPGATVTVVGHGEYGQTLSRADGRYDLMVNGGGALTLRFRKDGHLVAQRTADVPWGGYAHLPDVVLVPHDPAATLVDLSSAAAPFQVARGSEVTDASGTRRATLLVPRGTSAQMVFPDGSTAPISRMTMRATEFTVGPTGPLAMPAELPPASGYTYAFELGADEAIAAGAVEVRFDRPWPFYVEDFIGFPVGSAVPTGSYDRARAAWVAAANGRVLEVVGLDGDAATLDADGDGDADAQDDQALAALGVSVDERRELALLYPVAPRRLWRVPVDHFTAPWDCNWPYGPPADAALPDNPPPRRRGGQERDPCEEPGRSVVECQGQVLRESIPVAGTPWRLNYRSDRMPGWKASRILDVALTGATVPDSLLGVTLQVSVAGRVIEAWFPPSPGLSHLVEWDGRDGEGRPVRGWQRATVSIGYVYEAVYYPQPADLAAAFGRLRAPASGFASASRGRVRIVLFQHFAERLLGAGGAPDAALAGWSVDPVHSIDQGTATLHRGDGTDRDGATLAMLTHVAGDTGPCTGTSTESCGNGGRARSADFFQINDVAAAPDGSLYVADFNEIRRIDRDGRIRWVAGRYTWICDAASWPCGDGGPAIDARFTRVLAIAPAPDGSLFVNDQNRVRRIRPDGVIEAFAGVLAWADGAAHCDGESGPAAEAALGVLLGLAVAPDGTVYVADRDSHVVRQVGTDGLIRTFAGQCGLRGASGEGGLATEARLDSPRDVALGPDGGVYVAGTHRVHRVAPDGTIATFAGNGLSGATGDGGPATAAQVGEPASLAVGPAGLFIAQSPFLRRVRAVLPSGIIVTVAGSGAVCLAGGGSYASCGDGGPPTAASVDPVGVAVTPDGSLHVATTIAVFKVALARVAGLEFAASASDDGSEAYMFDLSGERHVATRDGRLGTVRHAFERDAAGRLAAIVDAHGNRTTFERSGAGELTAIVGPYGHRTAVTVNGDGLLESVVEPSGARTSMTYGPGGLLATLAARDGGVRRFGWDEVGRLASDGGDAAGTLRLERLEIADGVEVRSTTGEGLTTVDALSAPEGQPAVRTRTFPDGTRNRRSYAADGTLTTTLASGTSLTLRRGPDPRFGMVAPLVASHAVATPGGLASAYAEARAATLPASADALHPSALQATHTVNGSTWRTAWQASSRTTTRTLPSGRLVVTVDDALGRPVEHRVPGVASLFLERDARGRISRASHGSGAAAHGFAFAYGADGSLTGITDPLGRTLSLAYDPAGRPSSVALPDGRVVSLGWSPVGDLVSVRPPGGAAHALRYDAARRLVEYAPPGGTGATLLGYDLDGRLTSIAHPDGRAAAFDYDAGGRLASTSLARGTVSYGYDAASGNLATAAAPGVALALGYDGGLVTSLAWSGAVAGRVDLTHDRFFALAGERVNGAFETTYAYDADRLLARAGDLVVTRDAASGFATGASLGVTADAWTYDPYGAVAGHRLDVGGVPRLEVAYTRDALGRVVRADETVGGVTATTAYAYDAAGRLHEVTRDGALLARYDYDADGNRVALTDAGGTVAGTYDAQDRIATWGAATYAHRADGTRSARTAGAAASYDYDEVGNLVAVGLRDGRRVEYLVDGRNRRVGKRVDGAPVQGFLYRDRRRVVAELDGAGAVVSRFVYGTRGHVPDYLVRGGVTYRIVTDLVGSPRLVVDAATGVVAQELAYDPFGVVLLDTNPGFQPFGFAGGLYDPDTGLVRLGARDYDPELGRWTARDPLLFLGGGANLYAYAGSDPVNRLDVTGLLEDPCDPPRRRCRDRGGDPADPDPGHPWEDRVPFSIPGWADTVVGWGGALTNLFSGASLFAESAATLNALGSAIGLVTWPIAFEGALQTGDQLADTLVTERVQRDMDRLDDLAEDVERGADGGACP